MTCSKWVVFTAGLGEGVVARGGVDERGLIFKPTYAAKGMGGGGAQPQLRQHSPAPHQTLVSSHDPLQTHTFHPEAGNYADREKVPPAACSLLCAAYLHWR